MNMVRLELDFPALLRWAHEVRISAADMGYLVHAALRAAFGSLAPQPFHLNVRDGHVVLGYADSSEKDLFDALRSLPSQGATAWLHQGVRSCVCKPLPTVWPVHAALHFSVLACPVRRFHHKDAQGDKRGEKDAFLLDVELAQRTGEPAPSREQSYLRWLEKELSRHDAVTYSHVRLVGHRLVQPQRRGGKQHKGGATSLGGRPEAHFEGLLHICNGQAFGALLQRGIGRHRAFGYGMLLVRPA